MKRVVGLTLLACAVWSACARPSPEQRVVADTATALAMKGEGISYSIGSDLKKTESFAVSCVSGACS
jgi:hypothetical protein